MAKIIDFNSYKKNGHDDEIKKIKSTANKTKTFSHPEYNLSKNCINNYVYGLCYKCGACGRKFDENGHLI